MGEHTVVEQLDQQPKPSYVNSPRTVGEPHATVTTVKEQLRQLPVGPSV